MTRERYELVNGALWAIRAAMADSLRASLARRHNEVTGALRDSIHATASATERPGMVVIEYWGYAGGSASGAYYGWFLEYGTGRFLEGRAEALEGYPGYPFNPLREGREAGSGWDIVGRPEGPFPGKFISKGIEASHWFSEGARDGHARAGEILGRLTGGMQMVTEMEMRVRAMGELG